jgi:hypothetical protein
MMVNHLQKRFLFPVFLIALLVHACSAPASPPVEGAIPTAPISQPEAVDPTLEPTQETVPAPTPVPEATLLPEITSTDCLNGEVSPIAESIAGDYEFTDYTEVVTWFCNGAEFEDILVALETESQTGTPADDMLQMLAEGFTWDEIWKLTGLAE